MTAGPKEKDTQILVHSAKLLSVKTEQIKTTTYRADSALECSTAG